MFGKILIANRGEIACRVIRTARRLGIGTGGGVFRGRRRRATRPAGDEAYRSAVHGRRIRTCAVTRSSMSRGAPARRPVHPGYGFLSENADFADAVEAAGLAFIGRLPRPMRKMGSKAGAKELMQAAGVPVVPGYTGRRSIPDLLAREAARIGFR
jgi:3-methylcrotonyl-CoA carboxylase alpha subunit